MKVPQNILLTIPFFLLLINGIYGQVVISVKDTMTHGIELKGLNNSYTTAIGPDTLDTVFKGREDVYVKAYSKLMHDLNTYLNENDFYWGQQIRCFNRIYFDKGGTIDYFIYDFLFYVSEEKKMEFQKLISRFLSDYKFEIQAERPFAQCSPVHFHDMM